MPDRTHSPQSGAIEAIMWSEPVHIGGVDHAAHTRSEAAPTALTSSPRAVPAAAAGPSTYAGLGLSIGCLATGTGMAPWNAALFFTCVVERPKSAADGREAQGLFLINL